MEKVCEVIKEVDRRCFQTIVALALQYLQGKVHSCSRGNCFLPRETKFARLGETVS